MHKDVRPNSQMWDSHNLVAMKKWTVKCDKNSQHLAQAKIKVIEEKEL
jgi:hypothetical protein